MARIETWLKCDLQTMVRVQELDGDLFTADNQANRIGVIVTDKGVDSPIQGGIVGYVIRPDEATVIVNGTASGNRGWIDLPASAYIYKGPISIVIKNGNTTIGACHGYMNRSTTDKIVDPGRVIPSISELLAEIANMRAATTEANTATSNANAATSSANTAASNANTAANNANTKAGLADTAANNANAKASSANTAANNANTKAGLADTAASNANTAAGKINNMTVAATDLPTGSTPTVRISEVSGHKHIVFGLVRGDKGDKGDKGDRGKDFHISKTFASVAAMMAYTGTDIEAYDFAMIDTGSVQDADTGKLYCYEPDNNPKWRYIGDLSGAQGIKGETGTGIDRVVLNADYTLTIYYTDGTSDTTVSIRGEKGEQGEKGEPGDPTVIASQVIEYQESESGTVIPTGTWSTTIPPVAQGHFLWTRITLTWDDAGNTQTVSYSVSRMGIDGSGSVSSAVMNGQTINPDGSGALNLGNVIRQHQDISGKLDKNQGAANAGKFMKVGAEGLLVPDNVPDPTGKADKVQNATEGNFAALGADGNLLDSGKKPSDFLTQHQDISGKADKVQNATNGNFASLDANGNLLDSGKKASDFLTQHQDISGKVDKNQGAANAGKALGINSEGQVVPVPFSGEDFTGATPASAGTHGYVPAPQINDTEKFLCGDGTWADVAGGKLVTFELDAVTGTGGSYGHITYISSVSQNMKPVLIEVSNPDAFLDTITVSCMDGGITLSCDDVNGSSTVTVSCLFKANPDSITSSEFDVLANRIGTLGNLQTSEKSNLVGAANELYGSIEQAKSGLANTQDGLAIVANGNNHAAISSGQFVYVKNHDTLAEGLYKASAVISANGALSTSNLTPDGSGGLNALQTDLNDKYTALNSNSVFNLTLNNATVSTAILDGIRYGKVCKITFNINVTVSDPGWVTVATIPAGYTPAIKQYGICAIDRSVSAGEGKIAEVRVTTDNKLEIFATVAKAYWGGIVYICS